MYKTLIVSFTLSLILLSCWSIKLLTFEQKVMNRTIIHITAHIDKKLNTIEKKINSFFSDAEQAIDNIAANLNNKKPKFDKLIPAMKAVLNNNQCTAIGTHFAEAYNKNTLSQYFSDYTYTDENKVLYSPFFNKSGSTQKPFPYDYTKKGINSKNQGWYSEDISQGSWFGPYLGEANKTFLLSYRAPFGWDASSQNNLGNVCADYSLENLRAIMADIQLLDSGYGVIVTNDGIIISHPVTEYLGRNINEIDELNLAINDIKALPVQKFHQIKKDTSSLVIEKNPREKLIYHRKFSQRNWIVLVILNKNETLIYTPSNAVKGDHRYYTNALYNIKVQCILLATFSAFLLSLLLFYQVRTNEWCIANCFSLLCIIAICFIWYHHLQKEYNGKMNDVIVYNKTDLEAALNNFNRLSSKQSIEPPSRQIKIKTGFFIQSIKFSSANNVYITGYAWQKFPKQWQNTERQINTSSADQLSIVLPEAENLEMTIIDSDQQITRWHFKASLRQSFNYLKYPFDGEDIWIRARFKDFYDNNIILVPDFDSYPNFERSSSNGLESDLFITGWTILKTFYYFRSIDYTSNFGIISTNKTINNKADLYFNIAIKRDFIGVFVAYMIPLAVIAFLLFAVLMIRTRNTNENKLFGFNSAMVLGYSASLFFVLIVSHMSLREGLHAKGIIYLEYFFFNLYIAIGLVSANAVTFSYKKWNTGIDDKWICLLYWPLLLLSLLIITVIRFT